MSIRTPAASNNSPPHSEAFPPDQRAYLDAHFEQLRGEIRAIADDLAPPAVKPASLDHEQAATWLNISTRKLDDLVAMGQIQPLRIGRKRLYPKTQLEAFLRRCAERAER